MIGGSDNLLLSVSPCLCVGPTSNPVTSQPEAQPHLPTSPPHRLPVKFTVRALGSPEVEPVR